MNKENQILALDNVYKNFLKNNPHDYDNNTIIPGLNLILKEYATYILSKNKDKQENSLYLDIIYSKDEISNFDFIKTFVF